MGLKPERSFRFTKEETNVLLLEEMVHHLTFVSLPKPEGAAQMLSSYGSPSTISS